MAEALRGKIKALAVDTPQGHSGMLLRESQYVFNYDTQDRQAELALGMPLRAASYNSSQPHPIFAMNLPEGNLRHKIRERYGKAFSKLDDIALLSIVGHDQIGRLTVFDPTEQVARPGAGVGLRELLGARASDELFDHLLDTYLASGVSGVQPKVMVPDADASDGVAAIMHTTARLSDLIVKASSIQHENLTQNEFLCMDAAKRAGIDVPEFHLSDDGSLFVVRRFDRAATGERLGFEDMSVLANLTYDEYGSYKYTGSYENIATIIEAYCGPNATESKQRFFDYFCLSTMVRNGDGHLKNFGLLYDSPHQPESIRLSPLFDVVTTSVYDVENLRTGRITQDRDMALKLNKSSAYPDRAALIAFGHRCNVLKPERVIERIDAGMTASLEANRDRVPDQLWQRMKKEWDMSRLGLESQVKKVHLGGLGNPRAYKQALAPAAPTWTAAQDQRAGMLDNLKAMTTGALLTFAEMGSEAIQRAGSGAKVDWRAVEDAAIVKSLNADKQAADDVYRAIAGASPAALSDEQKAALRDRVNAVALAVVAEPLSNPSALSVPEATGGGNSNEV